MRRMRRREEPREKFSENRGRKHRVVAEVDFSYGSTIFDREILRL
jgi:hypothetical protein